MTDVSRRAYLGGVAATAAAQWADGDYDLEDVEDWDPMDGHTFTTGEYQPVDVGSTGHAPVTDWVVRGDDLEDRSASVFYDRDGVTVSIGGEAAGLSVSSHAEFTAEDAKAFAASMYRAAEELERRRAAEE